MKKKEKKVGWNEKETGGEKKEIDRHQNFRNELIFLGAKNGIIKRKGGGKTQCKWAFKRACTD